MTQAGHTRDHAIGVSLTCRLAVLIVGLGVIALSLLSYRQLRLQAFHEQSAARLRQTQHDKELWRLRSEISMRITPEQIGVIDVPLETPGDE